jgi:hypothetical protein
VDVATRIWTQFLSAMKKWRDEARFPVRVHSVFAYTHSTFAYTHSLPIVLRGVSVVVL